MVVGGPKTGGFEPTSPDGIRQTGPRVAAGLRRKGFSTEPLAHRLFDGLMPKVGVPGVDLNRSKEKRLPERPIHPRDRLRLTSAAAR